MIDGMTAHVEPLLRFAHGLTFFTLGIVLLLLAPRAARLEVARRLPLLAVFGFCEAILAWDRGLIPGWVSDHLTSVVLRTGLAGIGYASLLAFSLLVSIPSRQRIGSRLRVIACLGGGWLLGVLGLLMTDVSTANVLVLGEAMARLGFALPGGVLASWGLRRQARRTMDLRLVRQVRWPMRVAGGALAVFGVLASLHVVIDSGLFPLLYTLSGVALILGMVRALNVVQREIERWIEDVEQSQALMADRERISRELHDGTIQAIYAAGLMLEGVQQLIPEDPAAAQTQLSHVMGSLNQAIQDIRRYIFDLRGKVPEADLQTGLEELLRDFRVNTLLETKLIVQGESARQLRVERRGHIFQIMREALSNIARHAQARKVEVQLDLGTNHLLLRVTDDGVGFDRASIGSGHGLRNIRERVRLLDGELTIDSAPGRGMTLTVKVPY
jgi:signal transduction histidine kinase